MNRPDVDAILGSLKPFQRRTVEHGFHRLFTAPDSTGRFLVADEVGLGKTLVARGIIARAIDHLWDDVRRIDVIYICSNGSIARANLSKLHVGDEEDRSFSLATRLTMLTTQLAARPGQRSLDDNKVNFVSFTPGTSFEMGNSSGWSEERLLLFRLLDGRGHSRTALMNLLQASVQNKDGWRERVDNHDAPLEPGIVQRFTAACDADPTIDQEIARLIDTWFHYHRASWPEDARAARNRLISRLRQLLAQACVLALEPDLVILDEFQRFRNLLDTREENAERDPAADLARTLFEARTPQGQPVRTLLLSATPYKLFTADAEIESEDHYEDFLATTRFLLGNDAARVTDLQGRLSRFGRALKSVASGGAAPVLTAKAEVEQALRAVMARTERTAASVDRDAMLEEPRVEATMTVEDVRQYMAADAAFKAIGDRDPMVFWKSAPYLLHFMRGYRMNTRLEETRTMFPEKLAKVLRDHRPALLDEEAVVKWERVDPANPRLRELVSDLLDGGLWRLLWMPPTVPYWPLAGGYEGQGGRTKALIFSSWNVVPDVVSGLLSYEAERRMLGASAGTYQNRGQDGLLRLNQAAGGARSRHRLLLLLLPCLTLADQAHPLAAPAGADRRAWVRERVDELLASAGLPDPSDGPVDDRWEWAAPALLDPRLRALLVQLQANPAEERPNPEMFGAYAQDILELDPATLGRRPPGLAELLTEVALGAPATLAARTLATAGIADDKRRLLAFRVADAFWRLFNRPAVTALVLQLADEAGDLSREEAVYWRLVLRYCQDGNLQAVLDESWHQLAEQSAWAIKTPDVLAEEVVRQLAEVVRPTRSSVQAKFYRPDAEGGGVSASEINLRTDFALRFGEIRTDEGRVTQDVVRAEFNSPFRPFVLASTSVGQEGLDFHPWCHRLVHWNLPGNPVDLEQREGRVHRYKGHAVRKNVAAAHHAEALSQWSAGKDLWTTMFDLADGAARGRKDSDLVPHWMAPGTSKVQRHVLMLPYTKEVEAFRRLKRQLAAYRVVFGQPRQEELVTLLDQAGLDVAQLREWAVDLAPPA